MIKYQIDENGFLTGNWAEVGSMANCIEVDQPLVEINRNFKWENGAFVLSQNPKLIKENLASQIAILKDWFEKTYTYKEQKYRRLIHLNKADDDGISGSVKLENLYNEAENKRNKIQELEAILTLK